MPSSKTNRAAAFRRAQSTATTPASQVLDTQKNSGSSLPSMTNRLIQTLMERISLEEQATRRAQEENRKLLEQLLRLASERRVESIQKDVMDGRVSRVKSESDTSDAKQLAQIKKDERHPHKHPSSDDPDDLAFPDDVHFSGGRETQNMEESGEFDS